MGRKSKVFLIDRDDFSEEGYALLHALHRKYQKRCKEVIMGRTRNVFVMKNYVVKLPKNLLGFSDNEWEGCVSNGNEDPDVIRYARTRMGTKEEIPVVFMEKVEHAHRSEIESKLGKYPGWIYAVDCGQVGFNKAGKLVAYDYGVN